MTLKGIRAFGGNRGGLNHLGDFSTLFKPVLEFLEELHVYAQHDTFYWSFFYSDDDEEDAEEKCDRLEARLEDLNQTPGLNEVVQNPPPLYKPGLFPEFAQYVRDDWNTLVCFAEPLPSYVSMLYAIDGIDISNGNEKRFRLSDEAKRNATKKMGFTAYIQNVDAIYWELYSPLSEIIDELRNYYQKNNIRYQDLDFDVDFPRSSIPEDIKLNGIYKIE